MSIEERRSAVKRRLHSPRPSSVCQRARRPTAGPCCLTVLMVAAGGERGSTPLRCHPRKTGAGLDGTLCNATKLRRDRRESDFKMALSLLTASRTVVCETTRWRHRVSLGRSAFEARPWCYALSRNQIGRNVVLLFPRVVMASE